jgi:hypothetical protein
MEWESSDTEVPARNAVWRIEYHVPRENGLVAMFEARGFVGDEGQPPRMDDLFRLFAKVGLELPARDEQTAAPADVDDADENATLAFPTRELQPVRQAA